MGESGSEATGWHRRDWERAGRSFLFAAQAVMTHDFGVPMPVTRK